MLTRVFLEIAYGTGSMSMTRYLSDGDWAVMPGTDVLVARGVHRVSRPPATLDNLC